MELEDKLPNRILRDWTDSYHVESISSDAERLFVRLIMKADDFGRYHADPRLIRAGCFPLLTVRDSDISRWLAECEKAGLIVVYSVAGRSYLSIVEFKQRLRESKSKFPAPDGQSEYDCPVRDGPMTVTWRPIDGHTTARASNTNTIPNPTLRERGGDGGENKKPAGIPSSELEAIQWASMEMVPSDYAKQVYQQCEGVEWKDGVNRSITNWRSYIKARFSRNQTVEKEQGKSTNGPNRNVGTMNDGNSAKYDPFIFKSKNARRSGSDPTGGQVPGVV